jgi:ABC-type amino acid transport substrate-binding protein
MTTVGYGDKAPLSIGGRLVALVWMFAGLIFISSFTAGITTALTVDELGNKITSPGDLSKVVSGAVKGSTSQAFLKKNRYNHMAYTNLEVALEALKNNEVQAVVHDKPILSYQVNQGFKSDLKVLDFTFEKQYYAFGLKSGSRFREPINQMLLEYIAKPEWKDLLYNYLGDSEN